MRTLTLLIILLFPCVVQAHKIRVFAWAEADIIHGEAAFQGGRMAQNVTVIVENAANGEMLLTTATDDKGVFSFSVPETAQTNRLDLRIVADAGSGHKNQWLLQASEYLPGTTQPVHNHQQKPAESVVASNTANNDTTTPFDEELLRTIVREEISAQLGPVKQALARNSEPRTSLQDILGGIGYIIGLAGLAAYLKNRKENRG